MPENWMAIALEVADALYEVGFTATHRRTTNGVGPNEWTPGAPVNVDTPITVLSDVYSQQDIDGTLILADDRKLFVEARTVAPAPGDFIITGSVKYNVLSVKPLEPGGVALIYEVHARE